MEQKSIWAWCLQAEGLERLLSLTVKPGGEAALLTVSLLFFPPSLLFCCPPCARACSPAPPACVIKEQKEPVGWCLGVCWRLILDNIKSHAGCCPVHGLYWHHWCSPSNMWPSTFLFHRHLRNAGLVFILKLPSVFSFTHGFPDGSVCAPAPPQAAWQIRPQRRDVCRIRGIGRTDACETEFWWVCH